MPVDNCVDIKELTYEPEDAAQEGDAAGVSEEATGREVVEGLVPSKETEAVHAQDKLDDSQTSLALPATPARPKQPLTYRRQDLCKRCQRLGPCCPECRAKTRNRVPE